MALTRRKLLASAAALGGLSVSGAVFSPAIAQGKPLRIGVLAPRSGTVTLDGVPLRDRDQAVAAGVVLIPQDNGLAPILTAQENLQVVLIARGADPARARDLLAGLEEQVRALEGRLAGISRQMAA